MKPKRLLFALFVLYWIGVYGVTFFLGDQSKEKFKGLIPTGYKMYAPITNTRYDIQYEFFLQGEKRKSIWFSDYIQEEYDKGIFSHKTSFAKTKLYEGSLKILDFQYQSALYKKRYKKEEIDVNPYLMANSRIQKIDQNLKNFAQLYLHENSDLKTDSVSISVYRYPMILAFQPDFRNDFTYELGEGMFYQTQIHFQP
jgi:hypothetical protein